MNHQGILEEVLGIYKKHGWQISRVLLSAETLKKIGEDDPVLSGLPLEQGDVDAVWFERPSRGGKRAIELRWLNETPFALFELVDESDTAEKIEELRKSVESRLAQHVSESKKKKKEEENGD